MILYGITGSPFNTDWARASEGEAMRMLWEATSTGTLPHSNHMFFWFSCPITRHVGDQDVPPRWLSRLKVTRSPMLNSRSNTLALRVNARWTLLEQSRWTKAFCASILAKCCNAKIDEGSCRAWMAPSCAWSSSDMSEAAPRGARPSTHWDGEKPPTRAESFFTLSTCVMHDSTCSLVQAPTSVHTRLKRAFNKPPCLSTRPNDSGLSRGTWCTWMLCSSMYCCKTPRLCNPRSHMIATGCPAQLNQRLMSASKQDREEAWPAPTFTTSACWKQVPMQTMLRTWYFCPVTSVNSSTSIPKVWLNV